MIASSFLRLYLTLVELWGRGGDIHDDWARLIDELVGYGTDGGKGFSLHHLLTTYYYLR